MRQPVDEQRIRRLLEALCRSARGPGRLYLVGGATAVLEGWRDSTIDVDLALDPEPPGVFEAIARLKDELAVNIELASPSRFLPELPDWRERSRFIGRFGEVDVYHYDLSSQTLAKIERDHDQDRLDVRMMSQRGLIDGEKLRGLYDSIRPQLIRYPAVDADSLETKIERTLKG